MGKITILFTLLFTAQLYAEEVVIPPSLLEQVESGHAESAFFIASAFAGGTMGIEKNLDKAKEWFLKSAEMGYVHGMYEIGRLLYNEKNYDHAKKWFNKAAEGGHADSFYRLSLYPIYGLNDEPQDCHKGYELLDQAIKRDVKVAFNDYAWMLATMPDKACRNGQKAWRIFAELQELYGRLEPIPWAYIDTKAAVFAEISEFNEAIEVQSWVVEDFCDVDFSQDQQSNEQVIEKLMQEFKQQDEFCYGAVRRLQTYMNREPWRESPEISND
ncbi:MAG: tetratricopeptide repeat protein [Marinicella sp.]|nr:sel1 repeat family protein [Xanthomonadales bacterium]